MNYKLLVLEDVYWVCRSRRAESGIGDGILAVIRDITGSVTIVSRDKRGECLGPYRVLASEELDPQLIGFFARLASLLARASIPIMAYSSYERDYILIPADKLEKAVETLSNAGYVIQGAPRA